MLFCTSSALRIHCPVLTTHQLGILLGYLFTALFGDRLGRKNKLCVIALL